MWENKLPGQKPASILPSNNNEKQAKTEIWKAHAYDILWLRYLCSTFLFPNGKQVPTH